MIKDNLDNIDYLKQFVPPKLQEALDDLYTTCTECGFKPEEYQIFITDKSSNATELLNILIPNIDPEYEITEEKFKLYTICFGHSNPIVTIIIKPTEM